MKTASGFNGRRFENPYATAVPLREMSKWLLSRKKPKWPRCELPPISHEGFSRLHHSTCSIKLKGAHFLTDPIWEKICGPLALIGPKRRSSIQKIEDLDTVDVVLLSHNHFDHMCLKTLKKLKKLFDPLIITGLGNKKYLKGFKNVIELDWWEDTHYKDVKVTYVPAAHFSARTLFDRNCALWGGFVLEQQGMKVYFAGDSGWASHFEEIAEVFAPIDYCFLPIGSYKPASILEPVHIGPEHAARLHKLFRAKKSIPIHYCTFQLGDEEWHEPAHELKKALAHHNIPEADFLT